MHHSYLTTFIHHSYPTMHYWIPISYYVVLTLYFQVGLLLGWCWTTLLCFLFQVVGVGVHTVS